MPTYDYVCTKCGHEFEVFQSMKDKPLTQCPKCKKGRVKRLIGTGAGLLFKGAGFYETDYKRKSGAKEKGGAAPSESGAAASGEKSGGDGKAASTPPAKSDSGAAKSDGAKQSG
jgi:putative FmdB family regulatory protein